MNRADFYQEKMTFLLQYPNQGELAFYRYYTRQHPQEAIGWLYLGREWEKRGQKEKALDAYRKAAWSKQTDKSAEEAREAYHRLLRERKNRRRLLFVRRSVSFLLFLLIFFSSLPNHNQLAKEENLAARSNSDQTASYVHTEVIAIPASMPDSQAKKQIASFLAERRFFYTKPYNIVVVNEADGLPLFTPLVFYQPQKVRAILRYNPEAKSMMLEKWYDPDCACEKDPLIHSTKQSLAQEHSELAKVLTLRNALFRYYQLSGNLPAKLAELDKPYPHNALSAIPRYVANYFTPSVKESHGKTGDQRTKQSSQEWPYLPASFRPNDAWNSLRKVIPLLHYPEPVVPLEPLRIYIHQPSFSLTLMSGSHVVRRFPIGIGKDQSTPAGYFRILQKISQPQGHDHIYGTRGLLFAGSEYAIHGTNNPDSIGKTESLGCVRLRNRDVEELYSFASIGTEVIISAKQQAPASWSNAQPFLLPADKDEETPHVVYHWLH